jgi:hypothetical protein
MERSYSDLLMYNPGIYMEGFGIEDVPPENQIGRVPNISLELYCFVNLLTGSVL